MLHGRINGMNLIIKQISTQCSDAPMSKIVLVKYKFRTLQNAWDIALL